MTRRAHHPARVAGLLMAVALVQQAATQSLPPPRRGGAGGPRTGTFRTAVPDHPVDVILARPTADSVTLSVLFYRDRRASVFCAPEGGPLSLCASEAVFRSGQPAAVVLRSLKPDTRYAYEVRAADDQGSAAPTASSGAFRTQRAPSRPFTFTVTADSHLDERTDPATYARTLRAAAGDDPDFHLDLGDTFMTDKHPDRQSAARQYLAQRYYLGLVAQSAPLFLALGNHDGEGGNRGGGEPPGPWALEMRTRLFPNPVPDAFYTGNASRGSGGRLLEDYYAWRWGDALLIVLDPFWYSIRPGGDDGWGWTLGPEQYRWLARTLESSHARFIYVFIHHLVGGDRQARGGAEASRFFEWGGDNHDGSPGFAARRKEWPLPVHDLLVKHRVAAVFHGHDHLYARQDRGGIVYLAVPQPGHSRGGSAKSAQDYGYASGTILGATGYLRVRVTPERSSVELVDAPAAGPVGWVADRLSLVPRTGAGAKGHSIP